MSHPGDPLLWPQPACDQLQDEAQGSSRPCRPSSHRVPCLHVLLVGPGRLGFASRPSCSPATGRLRRLQQPDLEKPHPSPVPGSPGRPPTAAEGGSRAEGG